MEKLAFFLYLTVLVVAPLLFGAVHTYAYTFVFFLVFSASLLLLCDPIRKKSQGTTSIPFLSPFFVPLFFTLLAYFFLQITPLPEVAVSFLSPETKLYAVKSLLFWPVEVPSVNNSYLTLAPYTYPVHMSIIRWIAYGLFFIGFSKTLSSRFRIEVAITCILVTACFVSLYGIFQTYSGSHHIWWFTKTAYTNEVTGTYINRNHFASFMGMALILAVSFSCSFTDKATGTAKGVNEKLQNFLINQQSLSKKLLVIAIATVIGFGLVLSASRAGILSTTAGLFFLGILFLSRRDQRRNALIALTLFCLILFISVLAGIEHPWDRFQELAASRDVRARYTQTTLDLFSHFAWFGAGLGSFRYAYPKFQSNLDNHVFIEYAHNDWVQFLAEAGVIGFFILLSAFLLFLFSFLHLWLQQKQPYSLALGSTPLALFITMGIHSYYDFNLHIPANFFIMSALIAIGYRALTLEIPPRVNKDKPADLSARTKTLLLLGLYIFLISWAGWWSVRHFIAESTCNTVQNSTFNRDPYPSEEKIIKALSWHEGNAAYWYKLSTELQKDPKENGDKESIQALMQAIRLNPMESEYYLKLGPKFQEQAEKHGNTEDWLKAADTSMERAAFFIGGRNPWQLKELGDYWLYRSIDYPVGSELWEKTLTTSLTHYKKSISIQSDYWRKMLYGEIEKTLNRHYQNRARPDFMYLGAVKK